MLIRTALIISGTIFVNTGLWSQMRCPDDKRVDDLATRFIVSGGDIEMPVGAFLLVRKNHSVGAIRIMSIDGNSTKWLGRSSYESYYQRDGSRLFTGKKLIQQKGDLDLRDSKGPGRGIFIYKPGPYRATIGKWVFAFDGPSMMEMSDTSFWTGVGDHGFEFAATSACNLSDVDSHDKRLRWLRFDRNAKVILPLADLPK